jgi:hypothetical protein
MTPKQALELIDKLLSQLKLNRAEHYQVVQAVQVLESAVKECP